MKLRTMEAARAVGVSKSTLLRAFASGRVSFEVDDRGRRRVDTAELERVFPGRIDGITRAHDPGAWTRPRPAPAPIPEAAELVAMLREQIHRLEVEAERERTEAQTWRERYHELSQKHHALLTDQRPAPRERPRRRRPGRARTRRTPAPEPTTFSALLASLLRSPS